MLIRDELHEGLVPNAYSTRNPDCASRSMLGVRIAVLPYAPVSRQPRSSPTNTRTLGRVPDGATACATDAPGRAVIASAHNPAATRSRGRRRASDPTPGGAVIP